MKSIRSSPSAADCRRLKGVRVQGTGKTAFRSESHPNATTRSTTRCHPCGGTKKTQVSLKNTEESANITENKGRRWKSLGCSGNVNENKGDAR